MYTFSKLYRELWYSSIYLKWFSLITGLYQRFLWWIPWLVFFQLKHFLSSKEEMEVASTVQPYEGEPRGSNDFDEDW